MSTNTKNSFRDECARKAGYESAAEADAAYARIASAATECDCCGEQSESLMEGGAGMVCTVCYCDGIGHGSQGEYTLRETVSYCEEALGRELTAREHAALGGYHYARGAES